MGNLKITSAETEAEEKLLLKCHTTKPVQSAQPSASLAIGSESQILFQLVLGGKFQVLTSKKWGNSDPVIGTLLLAGKELSQV